MPILPPSGKVVPTSVSPRGGVARSLPPRSYRDYLAWLETLNCCERERPESNWCVFSRKSRTGYCGLGHLTTLLGELFIKRSVCPFFAEHIDALAKRVRKNGSGIRLGPSCPTGWLYQVGHVFDPQLCCERLWLNFRQTENTPLIAQLSPSRLAAGGLTEAS